MEPSIFTHIINRKVPAHFIYEDERCIAILDAFPAISGQALVIPRTQIDYFADLDNQTYQHLFLVTKKITQALDTVFETERTCVVIEGFEVPHVHIKLYPLRHTDKPLGQILSQGAKEDDEILGAMAAKIRAML